MLQVVLVDGDPVAELEPVDKLPDVVGLSVNELRSVPVLDVVLINQEDKKMNNITIINRMKKNFSMSNNAGAICSTVV